MAKQTLTKKSEDMSKWYTQVIQQAEMADYAPVKGCMVMRPASYEIWEHIQAAMNPELKKLGVRNSYFPLFIPLSFLERESDHVEGFAPELAIVTHGGGEELAEKLVVRPTSETIMYEMYSKWIQSHRDLPLALNQWNNVIRWEKRTYFFLRTLEFLWQEAHTAHATHDEATAMVLAGLEAYRKVSEEFLAIPVIKGRKSDSERFAGANITTTIEALMPDGKALQAGTSHDLGQNFSKKEAFNVSFQSETGETEYVWQTSYGYSTRVLGALIMTHGDDDGLVIPPKVAPYQVVIIPVENTDELVTAAEHLKNELVAQDIRVSIDDRDHRLGWKINDAELKGHPLVAIIGSKELDEESVTIANRFTKTKATQPRQEFISQASQVLQTIQAEMLAAATKRRDDLTFVATSHDHFKEIMTTTKGFIHAFWCEDAACEAAIKNETTATTRCLPFSNDAGEIKEEDGKCIYCGKPAIHQWLFAQAY